MQQIKDIKDLRIGDMIVEKNHRESTPMEVVAIFSDGDIYCDFDGNEGDVWEFDINKDRIFKVE